MRRRIHAACLAAAFAGWAASGTAQSIQVRGGLWWLSGQDLSRGPGLAVTVPLSHGFLLDGHWQNGSRVRIGIMCGGMIPPGTYCPVEPIQVGSELETATLLFRLPIKEGPRLNVGMSFGAGSAWLRATREGVISGYGGERGLWFPLVQVGEDTEWRVARRLPFRVVGALRGALAYRTTYECVDCAPPSYDGGFQLAGVELGIAWPLGGARR